VKRGAAHEGDVDQARVDRGLSIASASCADIPGPLDTAEICARDAIAAEEVGTSTMDDEFEIIARTLPGGFAGVTTTEMFLKRPEFAETVRESARRLGSCPNRHVSTLYLYLIQHNDVREVRYDWVELRRWYARLFDLGGWRTGDINESINRLSFTFQTQADLDAFRTKAQALDIPNDVIDLAVRPLASYP
jgi:hypothetical protein